MRRPRGEKRGLFCMRWRKVMQKSRDHCPRERRCEKCVFTCDLRGRSHAGMCVSVPYCSALCRGRGGTTRETPARAFENRISISQVPLSCGRATHTLFFLLVSLPFRQVDEPSFVRSFARCLNSLSANHFALLSHAKNACDANETRKEKFSLRLFFALY